MMKKLKMPKDDRITGFRDVTPETRFLFKAAAQLKGQNLGECANEALRAHATQILGKEAANALVKRYKTKHNDHAP